MSAFEGQEFVIAAAVAVGVLAAHIGAGGVDGAAAFVLVEEHAHAFVDVILAVAQDLFVGVLGFVVIGEFLAGSGFG